MPNFTVESFHLFQLGQSLTFPSLQLPLRVLQLSEPTGEFLNVSDGLRDVFVLIKMGFTLHFIQT